MVFVLLDPLLMSAIITHRIIEAIDNKIILRLIALNILKVFDKVWYRGMLHKLSSCGITGRVLSCQVFPMKFVSNGQSFDAHKLHADVTQGSFLSPIL